MDIKLKDFEGPLDLLLHLVSKYQMDIYDVPITEVKGLQLCQGPTRVDPTDGINLYPCDGSVCKQ